MYAVTNVLTLAASLCLETNYSAFIVWYQIYIALKITSTCSYYVHNNQTPELFKTTVLCRPIKVQIFYELCQLKITTVRLNRLSKLI